MIIGVVGAMQAELSFVEERLMEVAEQVLKTPKITIWKYNKTTIILQVVGIGKVNSAINTQMLWEQYHPDFLINVGTALALKKTILVGTLCLIKQAMYFDVDLTAFNYQYGQLPNLPARYDCYYDITPNFIKNDNLIIGNIATGDKFIDQKHQVKMIQNQLRSEILVVDMEAAAISQVAYINQCPLVILKVISDNIEDKTTNAKQFQDNLETVSAKLGLVTITLIDEIINKRGNR